MMLVEKPQRWTVWVKGDTNFGSPGKDLNGDKILSFKELTSALAAAKGATLLPVDESSTDKPIADGMMGGYAFLVPMVGTLEQARATDRVKGMRVLQLPQEK
jgi:hypothetical protein